ncbi:putative receptor-like protein kinase [Salvia divinorum]|uniref:Receptor-like protein kinase n=1 Tax=Salvia divinorum TaxID=28513 RepID=A0ABD1I9V4_SALDI
MAPLLLALLFLQMALSPTMVATDCPLDLSQSNFTRAASLCSNPAERGSCCRYINAMVAISVSQYANATSKLGVTADILDSCIHTTAGTFELYGVTRNATVFCGFGTKIQVNYECQGRSTVTQMLQSPMFNDVTENCRAPLSEDKACRRCLNSGILYLRNLLGPTDNVTLSTCRDATFAALASQVGYVSRLDVASCFFGVQGLIIPAGSSPPVPPPETSPRLPGAASPTQLSNTSLEENHHPYRLPVVLSIGIAVTALSSIMLAVLVILIRRKSRELEDSDVNDDTPPKAVALSVRKFQDGSPGTFRKYSYRETKKATDNFNTVIGQGGFGIVYKAEFQGGLVTAVKRMSKVSEQAEGDFCRELEFFARLHHRHLVTLRGFCIERHERYTYRVFPLVSYPGKGYLNSVEHMFLMYEFMANGSLKDHLHAQGRTPLSWPARIQIAIDVANALEYLHYYCDPPLCYRDVKSSNILLDDNFLAKLADFGLAHTSKNGSIFFKPVNTDIRGTPCYLDPEYVITQELTEKSDVYSYDIVLLELITGRRAIQDNKNIIEWAQVILESDESRMDEFVDPYLGHTYDYDQLRTTITIVRWCTQREGRARPSIKQVLRLLYEISDPMHSGFVEAIEDEDGEGMENQGRKIRGKNVFFTGDRNLASSSSTSRSYCSRSFLLEMGSLQSPNNMPSI